MPYVKFCTIILVKLVLKDSAQIAGNGIFKIFRRRIPPYPPKNLAPQPLEAGQIFLAGYATVTNVSVNAVNEPKYPSGGQKSAPSRTMNANADP